MAVPDDLDRHEQYEDMRPYLDKLLKILAPYERDNDTPHGRLKWELEWLDQEIKADRLPIPLPRHETPTVRYLFMEPMFPEGFPDITYELQQIAAISEGTLLIKPRHYPRIIEMIDEFCTLLQEHQTTETRELYLAMAKEYQCVGRKLYHGIAELPQRMTDYPGIDRTRLNTLADDLWQKHFNLSGCVFEGERPAPRTQPLSDKVPDWVLAAE